MKFDLLSNNKKSSNTNIIHRSKSTTYKSPNDFNISKKLNFNEETKKYMRKNSTALLKTNNFKSSKILVHIRVNNKKLFYIFFN